MRPLRNHALRASGRLLTFDVRVAKYPTDTTLSQILQGDQRQGNQGISKFRFQIRESQVKWTFLEKIGE